MRSCQLPIGALAGRHITTIEGLSPDGHHPLQLAWVEEVIVPQVRILPVGPTDVGGKRFSTASRPSTMKRSRVAMAGVHLPLRYVLRIRRNQTRGRRRCENQWGGLNAQRLFDQPVLAHSRSCAAASEGKVLAFMLAAGVAVGFHLPGARRRLDERRSSPQLGSSSRMHGSGCCPTIRSSWWSINTIRAQAHALRWPRSLRKSSMSIRSASM